jgi:tripartite-type tricarboxylate transporter receptor subunit TctC
MRLTGVLAAALVGAAMCCRAGVLGAQPTNDFAGKTITIYVSNPPGGGYDLAARVLARHLGQHIFGHPNVLVANMYGAHGIAGANSLYDTAPRDGTALGGMIEYLAQY